MSAIVGIVAKVTDKKLRTDDDIVDRLSHRYTSTMLIVFAIVVSTSQYVGRPIQCWAPVYFKKMHSEYANNFCWIASTYYHPMNGSIPEEAERRQISRVMYYQWVPLVLLIQAILFNIPNLIWQTLAEHSGLDINSVIYTGQMLSSVQMETRIREGLYDRIVILFTRYLESFESSMWSTTISVKHVFSRTCCRLWGHRKGNYLLSLYLVVKALYFINAVSQLLLLNAFLGSGYYIYGIDVLRALIKGEDWTASSRFPRVSMCDFRVRRLGAVHGYTLQCVLPINLFNEKIYLFLWFWLIFVAVVTLVSLLLWTLRSLVSLDRMRYVKRHLYLGDILQPNATPALKQQAVHFVHKYLKQDGVFLLRLLQHSTNVITAMELTARLWDVFLKDHASNGGAAVSRDDKEGHDIVDTMPKKGHLANLLRNKQLVPQPRGLQAAVEDAVKQAMPSAPQLKELEAQA